MSPEIISLLSSINNQTVYIVFNPAIFDFTDKDSQNEIKICLQDGRIIDINLNENNLSFIMSILKISLFSCGMKIIVWDWKIIATYVLANTKKDYAVDAAIIDLKIIESYVGKKLNPPKNIKEAITRLKDLVVSGHWKEVDLIYRNLHLPLATVVIPHLECAGINDLLTGTRVHAFYEIDGQENGRLRSFQAFKQGFVPHAMKPYVRDNLKPRFLDELFMIFDFRAMEVHMLAWLSKDPVLQALCKQPDVYYALYEKLTGKEPNKKNDRDFVKKMFLPVIYGQSSYMLGQRCNIPKDEADSIVDRINSLFPISLEWINTQQQQFKALGYAKNIFSKYRTFDEGKEYLVRNFCIQSPAAVVCLEKLNKLHFALKEKTDIAYTIHDGYAVYAKKDNWKEIFQIAKNVLSDESEFCPGLHLKVTCRAGRNLNDLKALNKK